MGKLPSGSTRLHYDFDLLLDIKTMKELKEKISILKWEVKTVNSLIETHDLKLKRINC